MVWILNSGWSLWFFKFKFTSRVTIHTNLLKDKYQKIDQLLKKWIFTIFSYRRSPVATESRRYSRRHSRKQSLSNFEQPDKTTLVDDLNVRQQLKRSSRRQCVLQNCGAHLVLVQRLPLPEPGRLRKEARPRGFVRK